MSLHFKINPGVYVDATPTRGKPARPVFFEVKPQLMSGVVGGEGAGVDNQLGNFMSKAGGRYPNHVPREAFTGHQINAGKPDVDVGYVGDEVPKVRDSYDDVTDRGN